MLRRINRMAKPSGITVSRDSSAAVTRASLSCRQELCARIKQCVIDGMDSTAESLLLELTEQPNLYLAVSCMLSAAEFSINTNDTHHDQLMFFVSASHRVSKSTPVMLETYRDRPVYRYASTELWKAVAVVLCTLVFRSDMVFPVRSSRIGSRSTSRKRLTRIAKS